MHVEFRKCSDRPEHCDRLWFFRWGFGLWLGRHILTAGHDTRSRNVTATGSRE